MTRPPFSRPPKGIRIFDRLSPRIPIFISYASAQTSTYKRQAQSLCRTKIRYQCQSDDLKSHATMESIETIAKAEPKKGH